MTELLKPQDVKRILRVSLSTVYSLVDRGQLRAVRIPCPGTPGKRSKSIVRIRPEDLRMFLERYRTV